MSIVSASQFTLARTRKELVTAFKNNDWQAVKEVDQLLAHNLNHAFDDKHRDTKALIDELEKIVCLYSEMVARLPMQASKMASPQQD